MKESIAPHESAIRNVPEPGRSREVRAAIRGWLLTTGDKGVLKLYLHIQQSSALEDISERHQNLVASLYLYWLIAQISGQDTERRWKDVVAVAGEYDIPLDQRVDDEVLALIATLAGDTSAQAQAAGRIKIGPLKLFSTATLRPEASAGKQASNTWERVNVSQLRRGDSLIFGY